MREAWMVAELSEDTKQTRKRTNPEESSSRQALKKNKWPMSIWSWSVSSKMYSNMPGGEGEDPTLLGKWSNFFGCLVTHGLSSQKEATLRTTCWLFFVKSFQSPRNQPPFKRKHLWLQKKQEAKPAHLFLFAHVPYPSKQWNPGSDTAIGFFFFPILWSGIAWCPRSG